MQFTRENYGTCHRDMPYSRLIHPPRTSLSITSHRILGYLKIKKFTLESDNTVSNRMSIISPNNSDMQNFASNIFYIATPHAI